MSKYGIENEIMENSKRRKTTNFGDKTMIKNPIEVFNLNSELVENIEKELDYKNCQIDFILHSHNKKRNFQKINSEENIFTSNIPKYSRNIKLYYSKYSDYPTEIPKI